MVKLIKSNIKKMQTICNLNAQKPKVSGMLEMLLHFKQVAVFKNNHIINNYTIVSKQLIALVIAILFFTLQFNIVIPMDLQDTPEGEINYGLSGGFDYPLIKGFYDVEDWEVAVCLYKNNKEQSKAKETGNLINSAMSKDYGGEVNTVNADVEKEVLNPEDKTKTTNLYTVCWVFLPFGEDEIKYAIKLKKGSAFEIVKSGTANSITGDGGCEALYSDKQFDGVSIIEHSMELTQNPVIDKSTKEEVEWD